MSTKVTPAGSAPLRERVGVGDPVVVMVNDPNAPTVNVVVLSLVISGGAGGAGIMWSVKAWIPFGRVPLFAVM